VSRLIWRGARVLAVMLVSYLLLEAGWLVLWPLPRRAERRRRWRRIVKRRWSRALCRALAVRVEVVGEPPRQPCLLVSNHLSYLDIPVLAGLVDTVFVSKAEVARWPGVGLLATRADTIYVDRERKRRLPEVNARIRDVLAHGDGVVVFPEGTSTGGERVLPFRPSLLASAAELGLEVRCAGLAYASGPGDPPASESVCWWRDMPFGPHVLGLLRLSGIRARVVFPSEAVRSSDRKELAERLWRCVAGAIQEDGCEPTAPRPAPRHGAP
jgi:1-acyl-sn-glycerol-3-phosphate acyltransferase